MIIRIRLFVSALLIMLGFGLLNQIPHVQAQAAMPGLIYGYVKDPLGGVENIYIVAKTTDGKEYRAAMTDESGFYTFGIACTTMTQTYEITISYSTYTDFTVKTLARSTTIKAPDCNKKIDFSISQEAYGEHTTQELPPERKPQPYYIRL